MTRTPYPLFVKRDLDGFFGLFIDNLVQLLLIGNLCSLCGIGPGSEILVSYLLPGVAVSLLLGNVFYAWQAHRLAKRENRDDVTALPYGINTPSLIVYIFFVMLPAFRQAQAGGATPEAAAEVAWTMGLLACLGSGIIEFVGAFVADFIRRHTPRAALLSTLAGIAIGFISMAFALQVFHRPLVAMPAMAVVLITLFSGVAFPSLSELPGLRVLFSGTGFVRGLASVNLPGGLVAIVLGTLCAWTLPGLLSTEIAGPAMSTAAVTEAWQTNGLHLPRFVGGTILNVLISSDQWLGYLSVIVPMGLFNVIGSLQNIESAEAAGDSFDTRSSLAANGLGTIAAAAFGSCFPTTIYIGHPGWKGLGARAGYSSLNGVVMTVICLTGTVGVINAVVPVEAGIAIVLWIGIIITAQAFQTTPREHAPAVAMGLFPAIAAWGATVTIGALVTAVIFGGSTATVQSLLQANRGIEVNGFLLHGMIVVERGYIFTCIILAAISAFLIDRKFRTAAIWSLVAAAFTGIGLMHAYQVVGNDLDFLFVGQQPTPNTFVYRAYGIAIGYLLFAVVFGAFGWYFHRHPDAGRSGH
jgi:AGZA family xanthine/uracil permease-like MFS transporter